jgi:hypothetical protein
MRYRVRLKETDQDAQLMADSVSCIVFEIATFTATGTTRFVYQALTPGQTRIPGGAGAQYLQFIEMIESHPTSLLSR